MYRFHCLNLTLLGALLPALLPALLLAQGPHPSLRLYGERFGTRTFLVDANGLVTHTWNASGSPGLGVYVAEDGSLLRTINTGTPQGVAGGAGGGLQRFALDSSLLWDFSYNSNGVWSHHDIEPMPNGNVLMIAWEDKSSAEAVAAGRDPNTVTTMFRPDHIIEVQQTGPTTGAIVWQWHAFDHLIQDFDATQANFGVVRDHPELLDINYPPSGLATDWNHCNGIDYDPVNDWIVLSSLHNDEIWIIDHSTTTAEAAGHTGGNHGMGGDLLYRWGNPAAYQRGTTANQLLFGQHAANFIPLGYPGAGNILLYNNRLPGGAAAQEIALPLDAANRFILTPGQPYGPAAPAWSYTTGSTSPILSSAVRAPNGNTLICNGQAGLLVEINATGQQIWAHSRFGSIFHAHYVERDLWVDRATASVTAGSTTRFDLIAGSAQANHGHVLVGSFTGTLPGTMVKGQLLPLNPDAYFVAMVSQPNVAPFGGTLGVLDFSGRASATLTLPPGLPGLAGVHLDHAFVSFDPTTLAVTRISNVVPLDLVR